MASKRISINAAEPGMVTTDPVMDEKGRTICGPGTELTGNLLGRLERMGVSILHVESGAGADEGDCQARRDEIEARFAHVGPGNLLSELKSVLLERLREGSRT